MKVFLANHDTHTLTLNKHNEKWPWEGFLHGLRTEIAQPSPTLHLSGNEAELGLELAGDWPSMGFLNCGRCDMNQSSWEQTDSQEQSPNSHTGADVEYTGVLAETGLQCGSTTQGESLVSSWPSSPAPQRVLYYLVPCAVQGPLTSNLWFPCLQVIHVPPFCPKRTYLGITEAPLGAGEGKSNQRINLPTQESLIPF